MTPTPDPTAGRVRTAPPVGGDHARPATTAVA